MESTALVSFGVVVILASVLGAIFLYFGLPLILSYLAAGVVVHFLGKFAGFGAELSFLPQIGLSFLLFLVGMELDLRKLSQVGVKVVVLSVVNMVVISGLGYLTGTSLGLTPLSSFYLGVALSFSSTILVVKILVDNKDLDSLHGRLSLGILLVQDIAAVVVLMFLATGVENLGIPELGYLILKGVVLVSLAFVLGKYVLGRVFAIVSHWSELLFLTAIAICFLMGGVAFFLGFSFLTGAFLAGVTLASLDFKIQIAAKVKPLRDLFVAVFFVDLGVRLGGSLVSVDISKVFIFLFLVMLVKPLVFLLTLSALGFKRYTSYWVSLSLSQISEFSLVVSAVALSLGDLDQSIVAAIGVVAVLSMTLSGAAMGKGKAIYRLFLPLLKFVAGPEKPDGLSPAISGHVVVVGCERSGRRVVQYLRQSHAKLVVVDFNPDVVSLLKKERVPVVFGDISNIEVMEEARVLEAKLFISTIRDFEDNVFILDFLRRKRAIQNGLVVIMAANTQGEALFLKKKGASQVVVPFSLEGEYMVTLLKQGVGKLKVV